MNIKKYLISLGYIFGIILIVSLILTFFNFFDLINNKFLNIIKIITVIIATLVGGFKIGQNSIEKGYLEGIKLGIIYVVIIFLFYSLGLSNKISINNFLYYIIIILSTMLGSMIGINKRSDTE